MARATGQGSKATYSCEHYEEWHDQPVKKRPKKTRQAKPAGDPKSTSTVSKNRGPSTPLEEALKQFEAVEANLVKLEKLWEQIRQRIPEGVAFVGFSPEQRAYDELTRAFIAIRDTLPAIDGWRIRSAPLPLDAIAQDRLDYLELGEPASAYAYEQSVFQPGEELSDYRHRMNRKRKEVVRRRLNELTDIVEGTLARLKAQTPPGEAHGEIRCPDWEELERAVAEIDVLLGSAVRAAHWNTLRQHLRAATAVDLWDIAEREWPGVKESLQAYLADETEPIPVAVSDLGALAALRPAGPIATALRWNGLTDEDFERLLFALIGDASGYENPAWLTKTSAPDRGRDLSVTRVHSDALGGSYRERVIIQCKHWQSKSLAPAHAAAALAQMALWTPPPVDVLVIATSGRFTSDGVDWIEKYNHERRLPRIEMWPESHLERLLALRPHLIAEFRLR